jgi:hypothetical protein
MSFVFMKIIGGDGTSSIVDSVEGNKTSVPSFGTGEMSPGNFR